MQQQLPVDQSIVLDVSRLATKQSFLRLLETQCDGGEDVGYDADETKAVQGVSDVKREAGCQRKY